MKDHRQYLIEDLIKGGIEQSLAHSIANDAGAGLINRDHMDKLNSQLSPQHQELVKGLLYYFSLTLIEEEDEEHE